MKIETKFKVNDLVVSKYQRNPLKTERSSLVVFEIIEIVTVTCIAGTQTFYDVRGIHGIKSTDYKDGKRETSFVDFSIGQSQNKEYGRVREDEIVECPQDIKDLLTPSIEG